MDSIQSLRQFRQGHAYYSKMYLGPKVIYTNSKRSAYQGGHNVISGSCLLILHLRRLPLLPFGRTESPFNLLHAPEVKPRAEEHDSEVEATISPKDAIVQPLVIVKGVEPGGVLVTGGVLAEFAETVAAVLHVAAGLGDEGGGVGLAGLTWRGCESGKFLGGADDGTAVGGDGEEAFEEVMKRGQLILLDKSLVEIW